MTTMVVEASFQLSQLWFLGRMGLALFVGVRILF